MASTLRPSSPNAPARAAQVVVFPTPPLPDTHAMEMGTRGGSPLARTGRRREGRRRLPDAIERGLKRGHVQETSDDGEEEKAGTSHRAELPIGADSDPLLDQPGPLERHHQHRGGPTASGCNHGSK